jgi:hypothetical protein
MALVYWIMVRCPDSGKPIDSGIRTTGREAVSSGLFQAATVSCPYCHQIHSFKDNGYLDIQQASFPGPWRPNR